MPIPTPNLDDRRFQQLVDEAKRFIQQRCPEWTDHNVSDPGVTLIEAFAHLADQLLYRLNRVPDKQYLAFLNLLGIRLFPPTSATAEVTFWLSASRPESVMVRSGTQVATMRTQADDAVVFATVRDLEIVACELSRLRVHPANGTPIDHTGDLLDARDVACFSAPPAVGDTMLIGLSAPAPCCAVLLRMDSRVEGVGVDPRQPPLVWEAWTPQGWVACEVDRDETGGLNRPGDLVLHVPDRHAGSVVAGVHAAWLRCRLVPAAEGQPFYSASPTVRSVAAMTIGATVTAVHAETVTDEALGSALGVPGQRFQLARTPVVAGAIGAGRALGASGASGVDAFVVEVSSDEGWQPWTEVDSFDASGPADRHFVLDRTTGEIMFGPGVRLSDGTLRQYGAVAPPGARIRVPVYRTGGGRSGNVARGALSVLRSGLAFIGSVENRQAAAGGVDGETVEAAKIRGPVQLRAQDRAVTAGDYELLARQACPAAARVRCLPAGDGADVAGVRVLVVPEAVADSGPVRRLRFEQLVPPESMLETVAGELDRRRVLGARLVVEPPFYQGVTVVARVTGRPGTATERIRTEALDALYHYLDPLIGGPDGQGWPFGRSVRSGEVYGVLQQLAEVQAVEDVLLFPADPLTGRRGDPVSRVDLDRHALVFSHEHQVQVEEG